MASIRNESLNEALIFRRDCDSVPLHGETEHNSKHDIRKFKNVPFFFFFLAFYGPATLFN